MGGRHDNPTYQAVQNINNAMETIIEQRSSMPFRKDAFDFLGESGCTHDGLDGSVPPPGATEARTEDTPGGYDGAVPGTPGGQGS